VQVMSELNFTMERVNKAARTDMIDSKCCLDPTGLNKGPLKLILVRFGVLDEASQSFE
jgi:hypothetical protein